MTVGPPPRRHPRQARPGNGRRGTGYTLIEFVIALTLVALIMVLLTGGLYLGTRSWAAVDDKAERVAETRLALTFIRRQLAAARGLVYTLPDGDAPLFWGNGEMLEWVAPLPAYVGHGGLSVMRLSVTAGDERQLLFERWFFHPDVLDTKDGDGFPRWEPMTPVAPSDVDNGDDADKAAYGRHVLIDALDRFEIAYFGIVEGDHDAQWHDEWAGTAALPRLVRVRIRTAAEDWPDLVVELPDPSIRLHGVRGLRGLRG